MLGVQNAIHDRIAHIKVRRRHVDFGAQHARSVGKLAFVHALKKVEVLLHLAVAMGTFFPGLGECAAILANFFRA
jgi:hypothetical protein